MKIHIDQIPDSGLKLCEKYEPAALELERADVKFKEPIDVLAHITKGSNVVSVELKISAKLYLTCNRCLEQFTAPLSQKIKLNFPIDNKSVIDLTDNLREEIILNFPLKPLCRAECLGLCAVCGQNLNKGSCNCSLKPKEEGKTNGSS